MKKIVYVLIFFVLLGNVVCGQENKISFSIGVPKNLTNYWLVGEWENPLSMDLKFIQNRDKLSIGAGVNYLKYDIAWFRYYSSEKNTISSLSPYLMLGLNLEKGKFSVLPHVDVGYSFIMTDVEIYQGKNGGFYTAFGLDTYFDLTRKLQFGIGANYNLIFNDLDFHYEGNIQHDFSPTEENVLKSVSLNLNLGYRL